MNGPSGSVYFPCGKNPEHQSSAVLEGTIRDIYTYDDHRYFVDPTLVNSMIGMIGAACDRLGRFYLKGRQSMSITKEADEIPSCVI